MLDSIKFRLNVRIPAELFTDSEVCSRALGFPDLQVIPPGYNKKGSKVGIIDLLPNGALRIFVKKIGDEYRAYKVSCNAPSLLFGHNGRILDGQNAMIAMLTRLSDLLCKVVVREDQHRIIPGLPESDAYWSGLEIPFHIADPSGELLRACRNIRHPGVRKPASAYHGESITLLGSSLKVQIYRKDTEMHRALKKFDVEAPAALRFEVRLLEERLVTAFPTRCRRMIDGQERLVSFTMEGLLAVFRREMGELEGLYRSLADDPVKEGISRFIAHLSKDHGLEIGSLVKSYAVEKGLKQARTRKIWNEALRHYQTLVDLSAAELFSDEAFRNQPKVVISALEAPLEGMVARYAYQDGHITRAYTPQRVGYYTPAPVL
ncbi:hypothetical protein KBB96_10335 [Luteolibacter ambystomatis]|uniref:Uncharacterized protein n=1 Tax=Luteolibacter ambystomatis TaxID=2824561 RepID=A0A975G5S5_9BACT|nr:hypothetical protein [Luteolibacter ambystomatis]QUE49271.1 hypothetical protein KBB96_10335 [Luteolibacter ambystomatis]